jgi:transcriptional regulator with XRE-family HTH domain
MKKTPSLQRIGTAIRKRRESEGLSQEGYADKIRMHRTYYSAIERGEQNITVETLERICKGLGVKMWEVLRDAGD